MEEDSARFVFLKRILPEAVLSSGVGFRSIMNISVFDPIEDVIKAFSEGQIVVMSDDENRENEGDLICAAEKVTPEIINFMITHARGLVCVPMEENRLKKLGLSKMNPNHSCDQYHTAFMDSVDVRGRTTTGISAKDRAETIKALVSDESTPDNFIKPGHVFPLKAVEKGVLERAGHTEGTVDLAKICGLKPAGVICEILNDDGSMMRLLQLREFASKHNLKMTSVAGIIKYRNSSLNKQETSKDSQDTNLSAAQKQMQMENEVEEEMLERMKEWVQERVKNQQTTNKLIDSLTETMMPTEFGKFTVKLYKSKFDQKEHLALVVNRNKEITPLVRVHSECMTGDVFRSQRCDCGTQLKTAMKLIQEHGRGAIIYLRQEGRGIGLEHKLRAYELQDQGLDTVEANLKLGFKADERDYEIGAQILKDISMNKINLLTNNPAKENGLSEYGIKVKERVPLIIEPTEHNTFYMQTKRNKMNHQI